MAIKSAVNWQEKWYWFSNFFQYISEFGYFVFSKAWAIVHCTPKDTPIDQITRVNNSSSLVAERKIERSLSTNLSNS